MRRTSSAGAGWLGGTVSPTLRRRGSPHPSKMPQMFLPDSVRPGCVRVHG